MPSKTIVAIIVIGALTITALFLRIDGAALAAAVAAIAGLGGYAIGKKASPK